MNRTNGFLALGLAGVLAGAAAVAQKVPQTAPTQRRNYYGFNEIHVDQECRILPDAAYTQPGKKPRPYFNDDICHLENVNSSEHVEEKVAGHQLLRNRIQIQEQEFVLWNPADEAGTFVVEQVIPKDWVIDSDPQPKQVLGQTAYFPVKVQPGETVRLHVGLRRTSPMRAKNIAARAAPTPANMPAKPL